MPLQVGFILLNPTSSLAHLYTAIATDAIPADEALRLRQRLRQTGPNQFIFENLTSGRYSARRLLTAFGVNPPEFFGDRPDNGYLRLLGLAVVRDLNTRQKLPDYNTFDDAVNLLQSRRNIVVITGAGVSLKGQIHPVNRN